MLRTKSEGETVRLEAKLGVAYYTRPGSKPRCGLPTLLLADGVVLPVPGKEAVLAYSLQLVHSTNNGTCIYERRMHRQLSTRKCNSTDELDRQAINDKIPTSSGLDEHDYYQRKKKKTWYYTTPDKAVQPSQMLVLCQVISACTYYLPWTMYTPMTPASDNILYLQGPVKLVCIAQNIILRVLIGWIHAIHVLRRGSPDFSVNPW
ncbi:hypothetical protein EYB26_008412 [Talaromyces marneffei]|uniref:uncharacterized protein n=1 Tax=Talaromyces marneffei TaxID=37727 RepID=UPI0012AAB91B|nr:uncharacterized protein EYB26_008412 [Talaromyces marneffei]QGA20706.1 hypothetical protein EYB26_008412 [Talaromyces marneffei]